MKIDTLTSADPLPAGDVKIVMDYVQAPFTPFVETVGGTARISINGKPAGEGQIANAVPGRFSATETLDIGMDLGSTVSPAYRDQAPFAFTGGITEVRFDIAATQPIKQKGNQPSNQPTLADFPYPLTD